jgi:hypothetical protein
MPRRSVTVNRIPVTPHHDNFEQLSAISHGMGSEWRDVTVNAHGATISDFRREMSMNFPIVTAPLFARPEIAEYIRNGLDDRTLEAVGGVVRNANNKRIVTWLRSSSEDLGGGQAALDALGSLAQFNLAVSVLNLSITAAGFAIVMK